MTLRTNVLIVILRLVLSVIFQGRVSEKLITISFGLNQRFLASSFKYRSGISITINSSSYCYNGSFLIP